MDYVLAPFCPEDAEFLEKLFFSVRSPEFAQLGLPEAALTQLLAMQFKAQSSGYTAQFPAAEDCIIWVGTERAGRVLVDRSAGAMHLVDIALLNRFRNQGLGTSVLRMLTEEAVRDNLPLRLSVRFGNPAEHLYVRSGFVRTGSESTDITMEFRPGYAKERAPATEPTVSAAAAAEPGLTLNHFRTLIGKTLTARSLNGVEAELVLEIAEPLRVYEASAPVSLGDSFRLEFRGPRTPVLPGNEAAVTVAGQEPLVFFLSPFAAEGQSVKYESIFNRMTPL